MSSGQGDENAKWQTVWDLACGGRKVAAHPGEADWRIPIGPNAPGLDAALEWMQKGLKGSAGARMLFLVGGPGVGKSHAAASLVAGLGEVDQLKDGLAHRSYRYQAAGRELLLINDATITADRQAAKATLVGDIDSALSKGSHLFACVNRGVIIEEMKNLEPIRYPAAAAVINWLNSSPHKNGDTFELELAPESSSFGRSAVLKINGDQVQIVCLFLDVASLLEKKPQVDIDDSSKISLLNVKVDYRVSRLTKRTLLQPEDVPARVLFDRVAELQLSPAVFGTDVWNPIQANLECLSRPELVSSLLSVLRAGEIISGNRFAYRELWGAVGRSLVGGRVEAASLDAVAEELRGFRDDEPEPIQRFRRMTQLAHSRYSNAIFGVGETDWASSPVCRLTRLADPIRDSMPGKLSDDPTTGWSQAVSDAFTVSEVGDSPLEALLAGDLPPGDLFPIAVTRFDRWVDEVFREVRDDDRLTDQERSTCVAWYGAYLLRLYAVSNGIPAFRHEVNQWTAFWFSSNSLPSDLRAPLHTLLIPRRLPGDPSSSFLLPLYDSRTDPIQGRIDGPKLVLKGETFEIRHRTDGDSVELVLSGVGKSSGRIRCDFQLVREALSCAHNYLGVSEYTHVVSPRLERLRAMQLVADKLNLPEICVVTDGGEQLVAIGGQ